MKLQHQCWRLLPQYESPLLFESKQLHLRYITSMKILPSNPVWLHHVIWYWKSLPSQGFPGGWVAWNSSGKGLFVGIHHKIKEKALQHDLADSIAFKHQLACSSSASIVYYKESILKTKRPMHNHIFHTVGAAGVLGLIHQCLPKNCLFIFLGSHFKTYIGEYKLLAILKCLV